MLVQCVHGDWLKWLVTGSLYIYFAFVFCYNLGRDQQCSSCLVGARVCVCLSSLASLVLHCLFFSGGQLCCQGVSCIYAERLSSSFPTDHVLNRVSPAVLTSCPDALWAAGILFVLYQPKVEPSEGIRSTDLNVRKRRQGRTGR